MNKTQFDADVMIVDTESATVAEFETAALKTLNELELMLVGGGSGDVIF